MTQQLPVRMFVVVAACAMTTGLLAQLKDPKIGSRTVDDSDMEKYVARACRA